ncbi:MAG: hypothetical protein BWX47_01787 [candidate division Hyd24-12 bacterium ADurb.Bin004]|nr:MAG: hypothetical protein BWX47_01787 [candidate division Hyd24-12 bacterium ADurb.Bin004]
MCSGPPSAGPCGLELLRMLYSDSAGSPPRELRGHPVELPERFGPDGVNDRHQSPPRGLLQQPAESGVVHGGRCFRTVCVGALHGGGGRSETSVQEDLGPVDREPAGPGGIGPEQGVVGMDAHRYREFRMRRIRDGLDRPGGFRRGDAGHPRGEDGFLGQGHGEAHLPGSGRKEFVGRQDGPLHEQGAFRPSQGFRARNERLHEAEHGSVDEGGMAAHPPEHDRPVACYGVQLGKTGEPGIAPVALVPLLAPDDPLVLPPGPSGHRFEQRSRAVASGEIDADPLHAHPQKVAVGVEEGGGREDPGGLP